MGLIAKAALERRAVAEVLAKQNPEDMAAWIALSRACQAVIDEESAIAAARCAFEAQPENAEAIRQLASCLVQTRAGMPEACTLFERLLALVPGDAVALHYLHCYAIYNGEYGRAIELSDTLDRTHPGDPATAARIARAYKLKGEPLTAAEHFARAAARCDTEHYPFPFGPSAALKPIFTALAGDFAASERQSIEICQKAGRGLADLSHPRYSEDCAQAISRIQDLVAARDLFIFGMGPSLEEVVSRREDIASMDFASMTLSAFSIIEDDVLRPIGRRLDFACMTHPKVVEQQAPALREWFQSVPSSILILPLILREHAAITGGPDFLLDHPERLFWFDCFSEHLPPSPLDPLHFPAINTLICALSVGILARPRRIFLFGFDGQMQGSNIHGAHHYREGHYAYHVPHDADGLAAGPESAEMRRIIKGCLLWDSTRFNETASTVVRHMSLLFDVPLPPIYNVFVDSALTPFPRITFDRFQNITKEDG
jgi:tetratricopeptide (TPR) repeat protein